MFKEGPPMMNTILIALVRFAETVVSYALGAALIIILIGGVYAAGRWLADEFTAGRFSDRPERALRPGRTSLVVTTALAVTLTCGLAVVALLAR
jgi:hypothetical protein